MYGLEVDGGGICSQKRLTRGTVTSKMGRAAHPSESARCGAGAGCSETNTSLGGGNANLLQRGGGG